MFQPAIISDPVFTDEGMGFVKGMNAVTNQICVLLAGGVRKYFAPQDVRTLDEEIDKAKRAAHVFVMSRFLALKDAGEAGPFPNMEDVTFPNGPRNSVGRKLPKGLQDLDKYGVYKFKDLPPLMATHLVCSADSIKLEARWGKHIHDAMLARISSFDITVPNNVRPQNTGARVMDAEEPGGIGAYVTFPAPGDLSIIPVDFFQGSEKRRANSVKNGFIKIGNARLVFGMATWPGVKFPPIHFLTDDKCADVATPMFQEAAC